jgi:hypothetical protein
MYSLSGDNLPENYVLSKQNCEEEFAKAMGVIDIDKLAEKLSPNSSWKYGFIRGFNKAMELNKDKVFTESDIFSVVNHILSKLVKVDGFDQKYLFPEEVYQEVTWKTKQIQQPTEIDVEIVEQCLDPTCDGINRKGECVTTGKPKYDTDGCLILKIK